MPSTVTGSGVSLDRRELLAVVAGAGTTSMGISTKALAAYRENPGQGARSVGVEKPTPFLWKVSISNPPFNLVVPEMVRALHALVGEIERDPDVKVVEFSSAVAGYFVNHFDLSKADDFPMMPSDPTMPMWTDMVLRLSRSPAVVIARVEGRTRGGGNEFAMACDLRYAARGTALFGQPEVGAGIVPGGGGTERMPRLIGRDRALEVILSSRDYDAEEAERYGLVTRTLDEGDLAVFVDDLVQRLCGFDKRALAEAKKQVDRATLPPDADVRAAYGEYTAALGWPGFQARRPKMRKLVAEHGADVELRLGHYLGLLD